MSRRLALAGGVVAALIVSSGAVFSHGDVQPQAINTDGLPSLGDTWRDENPYRDNELAVKIGSSGYNQNCARCHGLQVISGGIAPDLRYLEKGKEGDEWFKERVTHGAIIDGMTKMPVFAGVISQEGLWAIRSYIESQHVDN
jgi:cytochrome c-550 PedF